MSSFQNPSLCVYIGNTSSFDDQSLINYCSKYGTILSCSIGNCPREKRSFCDFRIIEFANKQQLEYFLSISTHEIGSIRFDVKLYENLLDNSQLLNIDRKLFIGPILNPNEINPLVQFYKIIDPTLQYCLSRQDKQIYILMEFNNRQYIRTIIQQKTIPKTIDNQIYNIHAAVHPKEVINTRNSEYQICVRGLTETITEDMLIDYFEKRASVVACHINPTDPECVIIEFENEKFAQKLLDIPVIRLHGTNLSLSKVPDHLTSVLPSSIIDRSDEYNNDEIDELLETTGSNCIRQSPAIRNESVLPISSPIQQINDNQQLQTTPVITEPIYIPSPDISECGWTSPPRTVVNHCPAVDQPPERLSSKPCTTPMNIDTDPTYQSIVIETDTKPMKNVTNNISHFVEQFQNEIDKIKDEYMMKYTKDQTVIEHAINRLINDEQIALNRINRYLHEHQRRSTKSSDNKRKYS